MLTTTLQPRILTIDDNPAIHSDFAKILSPKPANRDVAAAAASFFGESDDAMDFPPDVPAFDVDFAMQGEEAYDKVILALHDGRPYSLVFCDVRMPPGWDGLTTIKRLWEADPELQIVMCSAYTDETWQQITDRLGVSDRLIILKKPFESIEVLQLAVSLHEKRRRLNEVSQQQQILESTLQNQTDNLRKAQRDSERLLNAIDSLLIELDAENRIQRWNTAAQKVFGWQSHEINGTKFDELNIQWNDNDVLRQMICNENREPVSRLKLTFIDEEQQVRVVGFSSYPIFEDAQYCGRLLLGTELTNQVRIEQQLHQTQRLESVGQLAAGVAHEINTPLQYIGDNLQFVNQKFNKLIQYFESVDRLIAAAEQNELVAKEIEQVTEIRDSLRLPKLIQQVPEALEDSIGGVQHVSRIVRAMKELSHPGGDEKSQVDINKALETTATVSTNEWKYVADLKMDLDPELPTIEGLTGELNQVFLNLIVNAAHAISDATDEGNGGKGKITLRSRQLDDCLLVEVEDSGPGIPADVANRVFDPFFTTKEIGKGTGQGLAIAHNVIVRKHGGRINYETRAGIGTTFKIELPLTSNPSPNK